jgi:mRNA interferase RelE/StbE
MTEILFTDPALDQFNSLEKETKKRIISKLKTIREWPEHYLKPLKGVPYFSLRIGDFRVIIDWRKDREELWVVAVGHRKNIYEQDF